MSEGAGLKAIRVKGLFGLAHHAILLDPELPTVITGANGSGKSTILRLVNAAANGRISTLASAPVTSFQLSFRSLPVFRLKISRDSREIELTWGKRTEHIDVSQDWSSFPEWALVALQFAQERDQVDVAQVEEELAAAAQQSRVPFAQFVEVRDRWKEYAARDDAWEIRAPEWMDDFQESFPVLFVTDQRLVVEAKPSLARHRVQGRVARERNQSSRLAVEAASSDIAERMGRLDSAYARASQLSDRRLPQEIIAAVTSGRSVTMGELQTIFETVEQKRDSLREVGLLDSDDDTDPEPEASVLELEYVRKVMATISRSTNQKLEVLEELAARLKAFKTFLDQRFSEKSTILNRRAGVRFELANGEVITPRQLSSGEQQMMVLDYELVFRAKPGTLVIVDEPELSLHLRWQDSLIDTIADIGRPNSLQFLMASHSPALLGAHPELERSLD